MKIPFRTKRLKDGAQFKLTEWQCLTGDVRFVQLDLQLQSEEGGDISSFNTNGEWDLLGTLHRSHFPLAVSVCRPVDPQRVPALVFHSLARKLWLSNETAERSTCLHVSFTRLPSRNTHKRSRTLRLMFSFWPEKFNLKKNWFQF